MSTSRYLGPAPRVSIIGVGNVLLGDDGFGPLTVEMFRCGYECGIDVEVIDLGTPGLDLSPYLYERDFVVLVDAVHAEESPGTLRIYGEGDLLSGPALLRLSAHDPGIQESLTHLRLAGRAPSELIIVGVVPEQCDFASGMSSSVLNAVAGAVKAVSGLLAERGVNCHRRKDCIHPNLWWLPVEHSEAVIST